MNFDESLYLQMIEAQLKELKRVCSKLISEYESLPDVYLETFIELKKAVNDE